MANIITARNPWVVNLSPLGMTPIAQEIKGVATNLPFAGGQFLRLNTGGLIVACVTSTAVVATSGGINLYAMSDPQIGASGTDTVMTTSNGILPAPVPGVGMNLDQKLTGSVRWIHPDDIFAGMLYNSGTTSDALIGTQCMIHVTAASTTGSIVTIDTTTTYPHVVIVDTAARRWPMQYSDTDIGGIVLFKVLGTALHAAPAA